MIHIEEANNTGSSVAENSEVEVKVLCFLLASYSVPFHQNEKRTLKHLPLSLIGDLFPFGLQGGRGMCAHVIE